MLHARVTTYVVEHEVLEISSLLPKNSVLMVIPRLYTSEYKYILGGFARNSGAL